MPLQQILDATQIGSNALLALNSRQGVQCCYLSNDKVVVAYIDSTNGRVKCFAINPVTTSGSFPGICTDTLEPLGSTSYLTVPNPGYLCLTPQSNDHFIISCARNGVGVDIVNCFISGSSSTITVGKSKSFSYTGAPPYTWYYGLTSVLSNDNVLATSGNGSSATQLVHVILASDSLDTLYTGPLITHNSIGNPIGLPGHVFAVADTTSAAIRVRTYDDSNVAWNWNSGSNTYTGATPTSALFVNVCRLFKRGSSGSFGLLYHEGGNLNVQPFDCGPLGQCSVGSQYPIAPASQYCEEVATLSDGTCIIPYIPIAGVVPAVATILDITGTASGSAFFFPKGNSSGILAQSVASKDTQISAVYVDAANDLWFEVWDSDYTPPPVTDTVVLLSDAWVGVVTYTITLLSDATIYTTDVHTLLSDAVIEENLSAVIVSDAVIEENLSSTIISDTYITKEELSSDAYMYSIDLQIIEADGHIYTSDVQSIESSTIVVLSPVHTIEADTHVLFTEEKRYFKKYSGTVATDLDDATTAEYNHKSWDIAAYSSGSTDNNFLVGWHAGSNIVKAKVLNSNNELVRPQWQLNATLYIGAFSNIIALGNLSADIYGFLIGNTSSYTNILLYNSDGTEYWNAQIDPNNLGQVRAATRLSDGNFAFCNWNILGVPNYDGIKKFSVSNKLQVGTTDGNFPYNAPSAMCSLSVGRTFFVYRDATNKLTAKIYAADFTIENNIGYISSITSDISITCFTIKQSDYVVVIFKELSSGFVRYVILDDTAVIVEEGYVNGNDTRTVFGTETYSGGLIAGWSNIAGDNRVCGRTYSAQGTDTTEIPALGGIFDIPSTYDPNEASQGKPKAILLDDESIVIAWRDTLSSDLLYEIWESQYYQELISNACVLNNYTEVIDSSASVLHEFIEDIDSNSLVVYRDTVLIESDAQILKEFLSILESDIYITKEELASETQILKEFLDGINSDTHVLKEFLQTIISDSYIIIERSTVYLPSVSYISRDTLLNSSAFIARVNDEGIIIPSLKHQKRIDSTTGGGHFEIF